MYRGFVQAAAASHISSRMKKAGASKEAGKSTLRDTEQLRCRIGTKEQWVARVTGYSSQYDNSGWSAASIIGPPKVYPRYGDIRGAWAQGVCDANQYIEVEFDKALYVDKIDIYETLNGGAVTEIRGIAADGHMSVLWQSVNGTTRVQTARIFSPTLQVPDSPIRGLRLSVDCSGVGTWCELDAIKLTGSETRLAPPPSANQLSLDLFPLVDNADFSDVAFEVDSEKVMAHRAILSARSEYFHKMFQGNFKEGKKDQGFMLVTMKDVSYAAFVGLLQYLYTNSLSADVEPETMLELMRVGDRFLVPDMCALCQCFLSAELTVSNVVGLYRSAVEGLPVLEDVRQLCLEFISCHMDKITQRPEFAQLPQPLMLEIIQHSAGKMSLN